MCSLLLTLFLQGAQPPLPAYGYHQKFIDSYLCGIFARIYVFFAGTSISHYVKRKLKWILVVRLNVVTGSTTMTTTTTTMRLLIKLQGFKHLPTTEFTIDADPSDTIGDIAAKIEKITGVSAERVTVTTGLVLSNPSGSFKKLDKIGTVSEHGLQHSSTLMVFIPAGQQDSSNITVSTPSPQHPPTTHKVCVGKAEYRSSASEPIKSGDIMAVVVDKANKKSKTTLQFDCVEYANAQEWLAKAFNNSGKSRSCSVQFEQSQTVVHTPRPTRYVPPSKNCPFERYV